MKNLSTSAILVVAAATVAQAVSPTPAPIAKRQDFNPNDYGQYTNPAAIASLSNLLNDDFSSYLSLAPQYSQYLYQAQSSANLYLSLASSLAANGAPASELQSLLASVTAAAGGQNNVNAAAAGAAATGSTITSTQTVRKADQTAAATGSAESSPAPQTHALPGPLAGFATLATAALLAVTRQALRRVSAGLGTKPTPSSSVVAGVSTSARTLLRHQPVASRAHQPRSKAVSSTRRTFLPLTRSFGSTACRLDASSAGSRTTVQDPEPQTGLFYHPTKISVSHGPGKPEETVDAWALSFLSEPPSSEKAIIAYLLPPASSASSTTSADDPASYVRSNPDRIRINKEGWEIMHDVLKNEVVPHDDLLKFEADTRESGWAHLTDLRHPLMPGRIATPENIIASVAFVDSTLNPDSYEINDSYRLVTGYEGPIQMADSWIEKLRARFRSL
ncbi:hypothetical protein BCV70DRAFT_205984 [Testicularia cyperi]|uniref:Uncharacterized protein n=1 Tax=Testicularia cyperi TaxID=1882483 RepID=A0A317XQD7_9BASI|nr:hypothetical protein BCV70DRAFT_205984 [Testicularia cyperi]